MKENKENNSAVLSEGSSNRSDDKNPKEDEANAQRHQQVEEEEEEGEGKYSMVRHHVEKFFKQTKFGKWIEIFMSIISFISSVAFVVMSYWDLSTFDYCCQNAHTLKAKLNCTPKCTEFYNIR